MCPLPTFSGRFRYAGRVMAASPPKEKRGGFGANKFARNPVALFLPAQSVIIRFQFRFELRARADSPLYRGSLPLRGEATCGRSGGVRGAAMPRLFDSDYHDCVSRCCLGLARRLPAPSGSARCAPPVARPSGDRCAVGGYSATLAYRLGAFPLAFRGGSVRVDSVVRVDRGTSSRLRGRLKTHRGSFELDRGTLGGWGELGVAWQRAVSTAGLKRGADGRAAGRRPNDAALMLGVARQAIWAKNNR